MPKVRAQNHLSGEVSLENALNQAKLGNRKGQPGHPGWRLSWATDTPEGNITAGISPRVLELVLRKVLPEPFSATSSQLTHLLL